MPRFSVVIPTFNRANLLHQALKSVLAQTFDDFEIIVSNGGSTDATREVVKSSIEPRIRYFESKDRLSVGDNYQKGLDKASGEYITFLSDDDAYIPTLLEDANRLIELQNSRITIYKYCRYYHGDTYDFETRISGNSLLIEGSDEQPTKFSRREALDQILISSGLKHGVLNPSFITPFLSNAIYHRSIFDELQTIRPRLFDFVPPDMYLAAAVLFKSDSVLCYNKALLVWSNWDGNATATASRSKSGMLDHYRRLMEGRTFENVPVDIPSGFNCGAESVIQAFKDLSPHEVPVDWTAYFISMWENFSFLRSQGVPIDQELEKYEAALGQQPSHIQEQVNQQRYSLRFVAKSFLNERSPRLATLGRRISRLGSRDFRVLKGVNHGFTDILGAARYVAANQTLP